jgi:uncharacterized Zn-binding protein involved in type VI secretion
MPQPAGQITVNLAHGPPILGAGCPTVLIAQKPAWCVGDQHTCPIPNAPPPAGPGTPHGPGVTMPPGAVTLLIGGKPAARLSDQIMEAAAVVPPLVQNPIIMGAPTVLFP